MRLTSIILDFEKVTKYPLTDFLSRFEDFSARSYPHVERYYGGKTETIDNEHLIALQWLTNEVKTLNAQFKNFTNRFAVCGYWELMEFIENINTIIERTNKLPKFKRTALTKRGYKPYVQLNGSVGSFRTVEDVTSKIAGYSDQETAWQDLMRDNDMGEGDWEIDQLKPVTVYVSNQNDIVVTTILDQPIGDRIYGIDIKSKITFDEENNDLELVKYRDNIEQKVDILCDLNKGDVPENMQFGKDVTLVTGNTVSQIGYLFLARDIVNTFMQNDIFESVTITDMKQEGDGLHITVNIKTKYDYSTNTTITV